MTYEAFKEALFQQAKDYGFSDYELYNAASDSFSVMIFNGDINEYKNTHSAGISFRGTYHGRVGYAYTEKTDEAVIPSLIKKAAENAGVIEEEEIEKLYPGDPSYPEVDNYNPALEAFTAEKKIALAMDMEKYAYALDPRVKSVDYCLVGTEDGMTRIANAYGLDVSDRANFAYAYILARVEENGVTKTGFEIWHGNDLGKFSYEATARTAVEKALSYLKAQSIPTGDYPVIFDNISACELFQTFAGIFFAEHAQKGFSLLNKDKLGEVIANSLVTLRDDGICAESFGSVAFDSEGVSSQNKAVVENGVFKTLLYNTKSAAKDGVKSTGNGFKPSFRAAVGTACTNFYLVPSETAPEALMAEVDHGLLITELAGLHSGANTVSGDFSLSADGFMIVNGKKDRPVEQITIAGNFYALLKNIAAIGSDLRFGMPSSGGTVGMPSFLVHGLRISGL